MHEEFERVAGEVAPTFLINAVTDVRGRAVRVYAGDWRAAHRRGCAEYADSHSVKIAERREVVIAGCGGSPFDINLIQAHKRWRWPLMPAPKAARYPRRECANGLGRADFLKWFGAANSRALEPASARLTRSTARPPGSLLLKAERFRILLVSELADEDVRLMRMTPVRTLADALAQVESRADGYILPRALHCCLSSPEADALRQSSIDAD